MYVGRIVGIGRTSDGRAAALYRVSSRSFPNRTAKVLEQSVAIVPKPGHENMVFENPYVSYNCVRMAGAFCIATNGSQTHREDRRRRAASRRVGPLAARPRLREG